jgi:hypothetical protein
MTKETKNATLNSQWQDVEDIVDNFSLTDGETYAVEIRGGYKGEYAIAAATPPESLMGHTIGANQNINVTHATGNKLFVRAHAVGATLVIT